MPPPPAVRDRVLASVGAAVGTRRAPRPASRWWLAALATAAAAALALDLLATRAELERMRDRAAALERQAEQARREVSQLRDELVEARSVRDLVARPESRLTSLAGLELAPEARGRMIWNAATREAVLLASGLDRAPAGKAYEIWVIGPSGRPVPAGVFQPRPDGSAVVPLPQVEDTALPHTFAVTGTDRSGSSDAKTAHSRTSG